MSHTKGNWMVGKIGGTVVSDTVPANYPAKTGHDDNDYYGGFLIAESIATKDDDKLIAAAPELLAALKEAKEVLLQLDHRHNGKCYNPTENDCCCTLCFIDRVLKKAE